MEIPAEVLAFVKQERQLLNNPTNFAITSRTSLRFVSTSSLPLSYSRVLSRIRVLVRSFLHHQHIALVGLGISPICSKIHDPNISHHISQFHHISRRVCMGGSSPNFHARLHLRIDRMSSFVTMPRRCCNTGAATRSSNDGPVLCRVASSRGFSIAPVCRIKRHFLTIDNTVLYELLKIVTLEADPKLCPDWLSALGKMSRVEFCKKENEGLQKTTWDAAFNIDGLRKRRTFGRQIDTDGVSIFR